MKPLTFEIAIDNLESARIAQQAGADRVELCAALSEGGITPSIGMIKQICEESSLLVFVIIRPRSGDFLYTDGEFEIMCQDIVEARQNGAHGIVSGALSQDGEIDVDRVRKMVALSKPLPFTFHRAFDRCKDSSQALEQLIDLGVDRVLTSGQMPTAVEGSELLEKLVTQAKGRISIMPGSGVNSSNIEQMVKITKASEFHLSGKRKVSSKMKFIRLEMGHEDGAYTEANLDEISQVIFNGNK